MTASPGREYYQSLIDHDRLLVVPKEPKAELRGNILAEARKLDLDLEKVGDLLGHESMDARVPHSIRIQQDLRITVDDCEWEPDGSLVLKQQLRFRPGARHRSPRRAPLTQTYRQIWLRGRQATKKARALLEALSKAGIIASTSFVYTIANRPKLKQRFAVDPWSVMVTVTDQCDVDILKKKLSGLLQIESGPGPWYDARVLEPIDQYELWDLFSARVGDEAALSFHGLPLVLPIATVPSDADYIPHQRADLSMINAEAMWTRVSARSALSSVRIFLIDSGVSVHGDAPVINDDSVLIDLSTPASLVPGSTPFPGATHGTQMASIIGATWDGMHMAGITGVAGAAISMVSLRCASLYDIRRALFYADSHLPPGATGVAVIGLDVLGLYYCAYALPGLFGPEADQFRAELNRATMIGSKRLFVVVPTGNKNPLDPIDPEEIPWALPPADLNLAGTLVVGACDSTTARWDDPSGCSRYRAGVVSLLAPGVGIYGLLNATPLLYGTGSGTSFAAAQAAGVAALMRTIDPSLHPDVLKIRITGCCSASLSSADECGSGVLNGDAAIAAVT